MRSHYQERTATELYHQLSSTVQQPKEKTARVLDPPSRFETKNLVCISRKGSELKYDPKMRILRSK